MAETDSLMAGIAQISPEWLNRDKTLEKMLDYADRAAQAGCRLLVFGEGMLPGYPFWIEHTEGARFDSALQKEMYAIYLREAVSISEGMLDPFCKLSANNRMAIYLGCIERQEHSVFCSLVYIDPEGGIGSVHRKLMPTYEERLVWSQGDGHGLVVHSLPPFRVGGLNCWENWMPLARTSLYAQGENLHVSVWPGSLHNTEDISRFIARENRMYVISASSLLRTKDIPDNLPVSPVMRAIDRKYVVNGGSCLAGPDGEWVIAPVVEKEALIIAELPVDPVRQERLLFDPTGHYSRKDVFNLKVNRRRTTGFNFTDD